MEKTQTQIAPYICKHGCERDILKDRIFELEAQLAAAQAEPYARIYIHPHSLAMREVPMAEAQSWEVEHPGWAHHGNVFFRPAAPAPTAPIKIGKELGVARKTRGLLAPAAEWKPDLSKCPKCGGPADRGHDRCYPPNPYNCTKCSQQ